jgi:hypothetical protein
LRSSFVSLLLWEGQSLTRVAEQAGHSVATLARHYAGVLEELEDQPRVPADVAIRRAREATSGQLRLARDSQPAGDQRRRLLGHDQPVHTDLAQTSPFDLTGYTCTLSIGGTLLVLTSGSGLTITPSGVVTPLPPHNGAYFANPQGGATACIAVWESVSGREHAMPDSALIDGADVLTRADVPHGQVISVAYDSILFLAPDRHAGVFTAWLHTRPNGVVSVEMVEQGFITEAPAGLHDGLHDGPPLDA